MIWLDFPITNNEAEYEVLMAGLNLAKAVGAEKVVVHFDSQVVTSQINGGYECKNERMKRYLEEVKFWIGNLEVKLVQIPKEENECADCLAKAASAEFMLVPEQVLSFVQVSSLIDDGMNVQEVDFECNWTTPLISYLRTGLLPDGRDAARKLKFQASRFVLIKDVLYKRGFSRPYLRCLSHEEVDSECNWTTPLISYLRTGLLPDGRDATRKLKFQTSWFVLIKDVLYKRGFSRLYLRCLSHEEADYVMREVHEGICGNHSGARSLVHKLIWAGYYWPTVLKDAQAYIKACDKCQRFSNFIKQLSEELTPMTAPWPFAQWGLDIIGPFPIGVRQLKFLVVGIDYFTKWVEAEALANITEKNIRSFVWRNIICRFGIPRILVFDNRKQFNNSAFNNFCLELGIKNHYSSPAHPQANGQVEVTNRSLLKIIKTRFEGAKGI